MTRKDYVAIADAIGEALAAAESRNGLENQLLNRLMAAMSVDNPRFDRQRFLDRIFETRDSLTEKAS